MSFLTLLFQDPPCDPSLSIDLKESSLIDSVMKGEPQNTRGVWRKSYFWRYITSVSVHLFVMTSVQRRNGRRWSPCNEKWSQMAVKRRCWLSIDAILLWEQTWELSYRILLFRKLLTLNPNLSRLHLALKRLKSCLASSPLIFSLARAISESRLFSGGLWLSSCLRSSNSSRSHIVGEVHLSSLVLVDVTRIDRRIAIPGS